MSFLSQVISVRSCFHSGAGFPFAGFLIFILLASGPALGQSRTDTIAISGQAAPDNNGMYSSFGTPVINDSGQVAFLGNLTATSGGNSDNSGIFLSGESMTQIAREGQATPDNNGTYSSFINPELSNSGQTAFYAFLTGTSGGFTDDTGIFRGSGGSLTQIAREGQAAPDNNGTFSYLAWPLVNDAGQTAFYSSLTGTSGGGTDDQGLFLASGNSLTQIVREGQAAPDGNGTYEGFALSALNDSGQTAFGASLRGTSGGTADDSGIFRSSGGSITQIVRKGEAAPDNNGTYSRLYNPVLNNSGQTAFAGLLTGTSGGTADDLGIFRGSGGNVTQIVREGQAAPDNNGTYSTLFDPVLNDAGQAAFRATLAGTSGGSTDNLGIFRGSGGSLTQIVRSGQAAPDNNGTYSLFSNPLLNNAGQTAFEAGLTGTSGGGSDNQGIYTSDGIDFFQVVREGDSIAGATVVSAGIGLTGGLNEHGQIAYRASLDNGSNVVRRWTPELHWRYNFGSTWDSSGRWTLGLNPAHVHDVFIDPAASLTVAGPAADTTVRSLQIGGGSGLATLGLRNGAVLNATLGVTIESTGTLTGDGTISGKLFNHGTVRAQNLTVTETLTNHHIIRGSGRIDASIQNSAAGKVRVLNGEQLWLSGPAFSNAGLIEVHGGELQIDSLFVNQIGSGLVSLRDGSLISDSGISNAGSMAMTLGASTIQGDLVNTGIIQVSGGAHATFFGDVKQNGTMQISSVGSTRSTAVFLGALAGDGGFVGGGDVFALGDLRPGNSPSSVLFDGNLFLGASTETFIELGGRELGEFDQLQVTGDLNLAGDLFVSLIDGHTLGFNEQYLIGDVGGVLEGQFNGLSEGDRVGNFGGRDLFITYTGGNGNGIALFTAVPEPGAGLLLLVMGACLTLRRRRGSAA